MIKYKECPMCRQSLVDLSDNPAFVNHNPGKPDIQEPVRINLNEYPNPYCSEPGDIRRDLSPPGASFDSPLPSRMERRPEISTKTTKNDESQRVKLNLSKKEVSKDSKKSNYWRDGYLYRS